MCRITGLRVPNGPSTNYVPLNRSQHPSVQGQADAVQIFDAENLPLHSHNEIMAQAHEVQFAKDWASTERLSREYGVKGLDPGNEDYILDPKVWEAIGKATADSGSTIPSAFGARPPNVAHDKTSTTADSWSFWMLYLGPILLRHRFSKQEYFTHFVEFSKLVHLCLKFELDRSEIEDIRAGFQKWVRDYERYVLLQFTRT